MQNAVSQKAGALKYSVCLVEFHAQEDVIEDKISDLQNLSGESTILKEKLEDLENRAKTLQEQMEQNPGLSERLKRTAEQIGKT